MFTRLINWIKEVWNRMINQSDVKKVLGVDISISTEMANALQLWSLMYVNQASWLSEPDIESLNLPAAIAGEISRQVTIEMSVIVSGSPRAVFINEQIQKVISSIRQQLEYGVAKGGMIIKPYISGKSIAVDFVQADQFFPINFDEDGNITACVFSDQRTMKDKYFTRLEYHQMNGDNCLIRNKAFVSSTKDNLGSEVSLETIEDWANIAEEATVTNIEKPLFAYFRFPQANNIDPTSPLGVSGYARAIDLIEQADRQWSQLLWEFDSGKRAIYVDSTAFAHDDDGKPVMPNKRLYQTIAGTSAVGEGELIHEWSPDFREENILNGLEAILRKIEFTCGLAYGTLSNPQTVDKTATELKISQQRSYATVVDTQKALQNTLDNLLYAMDVWANIGNLAPRGIYKAVYSFDDSVIVDKDTQFQQDSRLVTQGIMSKMEFRMRNFGEDEATAKKKIADAQSEQPEELFAGQSV